MNKNIKTEIAIGLVLIVAIIAGAVIWLGGQQQEKSVNTNSDVVAKKDETAIMLNKKCNLYQSSGPADIILPKYIVRKGDTLLSVAKLQLGDVSRAGELAEINKLRYPGVSLKNSFLEVGWEIVLPPREIKTSGNLDLASGNLIAIGNTDGVEYWKVKAPTEIAFYLEEKSIVKDDITLGDCINLLSDQGYGKKIQITLQK